MNPYQCSMLGQTMYEERVREGLARHAARQAQTASGDRTKRVSKLTTGQPRFQAVVRRLVVGLFLS